jgi:hypothetical protein
MNNLGGEVRVRKDPIKRSNRTSGRSASVLRKLTKDDEAAPARILELYHYSQEPQILDLLRSFSMIPEADRLVIVHLVRRLRTLQPIVV